MTYAASLFLSSSIYSYAILTVDKAHYSASTIMFLAVILCVGVLNVRPLLAGDGDRQSLRLSHVVLYAAVLHLGLIAGFWASGRAEVALWVADSYEMHLPGASNVAAFLRGKADLVSIGAPFDMVFLTQAFVGAWFAVLGQSPVISSLALMAPKLLAVVLVFKVGKEAAGEKAGLASALIYTCSPTVLYYTTVFYKEAVIQMLVAAILLFFLRIIRGKTAVSDWVWLLLSMAAIINERFYLFFFFAAAFFLKILSRTRPWRAGIILLLGGAGLFLLLGQYADLIARSHVSYRELPSYLFEILRSYREDYTNYPDITAINRSLSYPFAFLKILFTPFFTLNKFSLFSDYSYILIWGSFVNQATIMLSLFGMYHALRRNFARFWPLVLPFLLFLIVFAYVAPYIGRLRDSFYPLISVYAGIAILEAPRLLAALRADRSRPAPRI